MDDISIHATHTGGDHEILSTVNSVNEFQSTPPIRVETRSRQWAVRCMHISIHATHTGGDDHV